MEFRMAGKEDIEQLIKMRMSYLIDDYGELPEEQIHKIEKVLPDYFSSHLGKDFFAFVAVDQDKIISTTMLVIIAKPANPKFPSGKLGEVLSVYTCPEYRRQGIAKRLIEMLLSKAKELQLDFVELKATEDGYPLYTKLGFQKSESSYIPMKYIVQYDNEG